MRAVIVCAVVVWVVGCASSEPEVALEVQVAPIVSGVILSPGDAQAREAMIEGDYDDAYDLYTELEELETDVEQRGHYLFYRAEAALGDLRWAAAYELYTRLLVEFPTSKDYPVAVRRVFQIGQRFCLGKASKPSLLLGFSLSDREFGIQILDRFRDQRPRHDLADDSLHATALAQLDLGEWESAIDSWEALIQDYPRSEWVDTAEFRIGSTFLLMSDGVEYNKKPLRQALFRLRRYVERNPTGDHYAEAVDQIASLEADLAAFQLEIAETYLDRGYDYSADLYCAAILREYPETPAAAEAQALRAEIQPVTLPPPPPDPDDEEEYPWYYRLLFPEPDANRDLPPPPFLGN